MLPVLEVVLALAEAVERWPRLEGRGTAGGGMEGDAKFVRLLTIRGILVGVADGGTALSDVDDATGRTEGDPAIAGRFGRLEPFTVDSEWFDETDARFRPLSTDDSAWSVVSGGAETLRGRPPEMDRVWSQRDLAGPHSPCLLRVPSSRARRKRARGGWVPGRAQAAARDLACCCFLSACSAGASVRSCETAHSRGSWTAPLSWAFRESKPGGVLSTTPCFESRMTRRGGKRGYQTG